MNVQFKPEQRNIIVNCRSDISIEMIYSKWKQWVMQDDNAKYLPAFSVITDDENNNHYTIINNWSLFIESGYVLSY